MLAPAADEPRMKMNTPQRIVTTTDHNTPTPVPTCRQGRQHISAPKSLGPLQPFDVCTKPNGQLSSSMTSAENSHRFSLLNPPTARKHMQQYSSQHGRRDNNYAKLVSPYIHSVPLWKTSRRNRASRWVVLAVTVNLPLLSCASHGVCT